VPRRPAAPVHHRSTATLAAPPPSHLQFLAELGLTAEDNPGVYYGKWAGSGPVIKSVAPATGRTIATVRQATSEEYEAALGAMQAARKAWAETPAPVRGEIVRQIGVALRAKRTALGRLVSLEMGKLETEGVGEVQEVSEREGGAAARGATGGRSSSCEGERGAVCGGRPSARD
jgi:aldehyde dehydrogenase family 7 member A1